MNNGIVPINDQVQVSSKVLYDIFYFGTVFIHQQITERTHEVRINDQIFSYDDGQLFQNGKIFDGANDILVFPIGELKTITTNKPKKTMLISSTRKSAISVATDAIIQVTPIQNTGSYSLMIYTGNDPVYLNQQLVKDGKFSFDIGDQLIVNRLMIESREEQLKITNLGDHFTLNSWEIVEEAFLPEYPVDFPDFRRSPRIHLKEPKNKVDLIAPKAMEVEEKSELLRTLIPPLGMVVLSGATSFLSGGNPIML